MNECLVEKVVRSREIRSEFPRTRIIGEIPFHQFGSRSCRIAEKTPWLSLQSLSPLALERAWSQRSPYTPNNGVRVR